MTSSTGAGLFFRKFLKHGTRVASVAPSSVGLSRSAAKAVDPGKPQTIVELGSGTGPITGVILERMHPQSRLLGLELDDDFAQVVRDRFGDDERLAMVTGSAADVQRHLDDAGLGQVDVWVNCLPTPSLPGPVVEAVLAAYAARSAEPGRSPLSQISVMPWVYQRWYRKLFEEVSFDLIVKNVPPGGVYHCRGLRADRPELM